MIYVKKLVFAPVFLIFFYLFLYQLSIFFKDIYLIFGLDLSTLANLISLVLFLGLSCIFFVVFLALANDFKIAFPVFLIATLFPFINFPRSVSFILIIGSFFAFALTYLKVSNTLKTYITFKADSLFSPSVKTLASLIILAFSFAFYLSANLEIKNNGFKIPDSLIDTALKFSGTPMDVRGIKIAQLTPAQIELLKQNPDLLRQYGVDPAALDSLSPASQQVTPTTNQITIPTAPSNNILKKLLQDQIQNMIEPYINFVPVIFAGVFFITLSSIFSLVSILTNPAIWLIFYILEKSGFITFTTEMRPVKKLVVYTTT